MRSHTGIQCAGCGKEVREGKVVARNTYCTECYRKLQSEEAGYGKEWLVRTKRHEIFGPFTWQELEQVILLGKVGFRDEVSRAGERWTEIAYSREFAEVLRKAILERSGEEETSLFEKTEITVPPPVTPLPGVIPKPAGKDTAGVGIEAPPLRRAARPHLKKRLIYGGLIVLGMGAFYYAYQAYYPKKPTAIPLVFLPAGDFERMIALARDFERAMLWERARAFYVRALEQKPNDAEITLRLLAIDFSTGKESQALLARLQTMVKRKDCPERCRAETLNQMALIYLNQGNFKLSSQTLQEAIKHDAKVSPPHFNLGKMYYFENRFDKAKQEFERVAELDPYLPSIFNYLGRTLDRLGEFSAAEKAFQNAIGINPALQLSYLYAGVMAFKLGNKKDVLHYLKNLLEQHPDTMAEEQLSLDYSHDQINYPEALEIYRIIVKGLEDLPLVRAGEGLFLFLAGAEGEALVSLQHAIVKFPNHEAPYVVFGFIKKKQGDIAGAKELLQKALQFNAEHKLAHILLAECYLSEGEVDKAKGHFEKVLLLDARSVLAHHGLGIVWHLLGNVKEAKQEWEIALKIDPLYVPSRRYLLETAPRN